MIDEAVGRSYSRSEPLDGEEGLKVAFCSLSGGGGGLGRAPSSLYDAIQCQKSPLCLRED